MEEHAGEDVKRRARTASRRPGARPTSSAGTSPQSLDQASRAGHVAALGEHNQLAARTRAQHRRDERQRDDRRTAGRVGVAERDHRSAAARHGFGRLRRLRASWPASSSGAGVAGDGEARRRVRRRLEERRCGGRCSEIHHRVAGASASAPGRTTMPLRSAQPWSSPASRYCATYFAVGLVERDDPVVGARRRRRAAPSRGSDEPSAGPATRAACSSASGGPGCPRAVRRSSPRPGSRGRPRRSRPRRCRRR